MVREFLKMLHPRLVFVVAPVLACATLGVSAPAALLTGGVLLIVAALI